jgi:hypothetical protein
MLALACGLACGRKGGGGGGGFFFKKNFGWGFVLLVKGIENVKRILFFD